MTTGGKAAAAAGTALLLLGSSTEGCGPERAACLVQCGESGEGGSPGGRHSPCGDKGRTFFKGDVLAILDDGTTGDLCAKCHSAAYGSSGAPHFLGASRDAAYETLVSDPRLVGAEPGNSLLLTKGVHTGPALSADQAQIVEEWLHLEAEERFGDCDGSGGSGAPPGKTCKEALAEVSACMTLDDWTATGMHLVAEQPTLQGQCYGCHGSGMGGNYMTQPNTDASIHDGFDAMRQVAFLPKLVTCSLDADDGAFEGIVPAYRWRDKGGEGEHPKYVLSDEHLATLDTWFAIVSTKWKSGPCGP